MNRYPCGWLFNLPRFCKGRKCETCVLRKENRHEGSTDIHTAEVVRADSERKKDHRGQEDQAEMVCRNIEVKKEGRDQKNQADRQRTV